MSLKLLKETDSGLEFIIDYIYIFTGYSLFQDLLYNYSFNNITFIHIIDLDPDHFIDSKGRIVSNANIQIQIECHISINQILEVIIEDII